MHMLEGKVAIVTGAGRGIGRAVAELLAAQGAKVVVNDAGVAEDGSGHDAGPAEQVAKEIVAAGGDAVANTASVASMEGGQSMVDDAIKAYGRLDILVNNAGILRDRIFHKMSEAEWDDVISVHLKGAFACSRAAATHFRSEERGRIINFTSAAGLIGNTGQANYAAAKAGIVGFTRALAFDLARFGVTANCVAPVAWTRLVGTIPTADDALAAKVKSLQQLTPELIAPLVGYLASDDAAAVTGQVFGVRGKEILLYSQPRPVATVGRAEGWTPEAVGSAVTGIMRPHMADFIPSIRFFDYEPLL